MTTQMSRELEKLLDQFKRYSQQAGIAHQKVVGGTGSLDDTNAWLDKAEEKRAEILEWVRTTLPTIRLHDPTTTTTHPNVPPEHHALCLNAKDFPVKGCRWCDPDLAGWTRVGGD